MTTYVYKYVDCSRLLLLFLLLHTRYVYDVMSECLLYHVYCDIRQTTCNNCTVTIFIIYNAVVMYTTIHRLRRVYRIAIRDQWALTKRNTLCINVCCVVWPLWVSFVPFLEDLQPYGTVPYDYRSNVTYHTQ